MRGQAGLISTMIMVGVVLVIGIAALAYFNTSMAAQRAELQLQSLLAVESSRTVTSIVYGNGTDYVIFLTKKMTEARIDILVLGTTSGGVRYDYLGFGQDYDLYYADPQANVPYYNITDLTGWDPVPSLIRGARQIYIKDPTGTSPYMALSEYCDNLPATGAVAMGRLFIEPNEPVLLRVHLAPDLPIDTAWVMIMLEISDSSYQIATVPLPYHG